MMPMCIYCDNKTTISTFHNPVLHDRTQHIEVDKHFIKEKIDTEMICISNSLTIEQIIDILTKGTPTVAIQETDWQSENERHLQTSYKESVIYFFF